MWKANFGNIFLFFFVKYLLFYILLMFKNNDYSLIEIGSLKNSEDVFYYLWIFLFLPILSIILFTAPLFFAFKVMNRLFFILLISAILIAEYFLYTHFASQADLINGVYNSIISILLLALFFFKRIISVFNQNNTTTRAAP